ncbi:hypothetical protein PPZ50_12965 [Sphingomonas hankookensis]|jgi:hypothetical protein|nr:hypothetical protein [Sphingomonas hankookensis]WCP71255.1 hypothetical protein PPZ50_12965 [Sphingomonas hankookensis]
MIPAGAEDKAECNTQGVLSQRHSGGHAARAMADWRSIDGSLVRSEGLGHADSRQARPATSAAACRRYHHRHDGMGNGGAALRRCPTPAAGNMVAW